MKEGKVRFSLSVIIPAFNEEKTIVQLVRQVLQVCDTIKPSLNYFELIIINDGSSDSTATRLKEAHGDNPLVRTFTLSRNLGKGAAVQRGLKEAQGEVVLLQDADHEYDPSDIPKLLTPIFEGKADVVYGSRIQNEDSYFPYYSHLLGNKALTRFSNLLSAQNITDMETCYKAFRAPVIKNMILVSRGFDIEPEITAKVAKIPGVRISEVPISYRGRTVQNGKKITWQHGVSACWSIFKFNLLTPWDRAFQKPSSQLRMEL